MKGMGQAGIELLNSHENSMSRGERAQGQNRDEDVVVYRNPYRDEEALSETERPRQR